MKRLALLFCALVFVPNAAATSRVPAFDHIVVIVFENKESPSVLGSAAAPTFNAYAGRYAALTRYYGVTHPSLPNYIALVSGATQGIRSNCTRCVVRARSLADTLEESGRTWKTYAEGLPRPGYTGAVSGRYAKKHNPFLYFRSVVSNTHRRRQVVPLRQLAQDLRSGDVPDFMLIVPDMCNSMHDCPVATGDRWLRGLAPRLLGLPKTVVFVLFDEGETNVRGGGRIPAIALGTAVRPGVRFAATVNHYNTLRTIEEAWDLPYLGRSARVQSITGIWRETGG